MHTLNTLFTPLINSPSSYHYFISSTTDHLLRYWISDMSRFNLLILFFCLLQLECKLHEVRVCIYFVHWYIPSLQNKAYHMMCVCEVAQSCLTLCAPMDCSPPGSSVHGIFQAGILEWDTISSCREYSLLRDGNWVSLYLLHCQADSLPLSHLGSLEDTLQLHSNLFYFIHKSCP